MRRFVRELKRRNVFRAATIYTAAAWLLVQVATQVFPFFDIPNWTVRLVVVAALVGFPFVLVISWFYELTPQGLRREYEPDEALAARARGPHAFHLALLSAAAVALAVLIAVLLVSRRSTSGTSDAPSIAVLPLRNLSADAENAYFAEGLQDEILTRLARIGSLRVISRASVTGYTGVPAALPKIAEELGVDNILEGSVQRRADEVRISVRLVVLRTGANLWGETFDRKLSDVFAVESEIAAAVVEALKLRLSGAERQMLETAPTKNAAAYDQYLRGLAYANLPLEQENTQREADYLSAAVALDPAFALAWARLSRAHVVLAYQGAADACERAGHEAARALQLQPSLGEAFQAQATWLNYCKNDPAGAQAEFERAQRALPNNADVLTSLSGIASGRGQWDRATEYLRQALILDPRNPKLLADDVVILLETRRFDKARATADRALDVAPDDPYLIALQAALEQAAGRLDVAQRRLDQLSFLPQEVSVFDYQVLQQLYLRHYSEAIEVLEEALARDLKSIGMGAGDYWYLLGVTQRAAGDASAARHAFTAGRAYLERFKSVAAPTDTAVYLEAMKCLMEAGAGDEADQGACHATAVAAAGEGAFASSAREALARAAALRGDTDGALALLPTLLRTSYYSFLYSAPLTSALLRQDPVWDRLRSDRRFQSLASEASAERPR